MLTSRVPSQDLCTYYTSTLSKTFKYFIIFKSYTHGKLWTKAKLLAVLSYDYYAEMNQMINGISKL